MSPHNPPSKLLDSDKFGNSRRTKPAGLIESSSLRAPPRTPGVWDGAPTAAAPWLASGGYATVADYFLCITEVKEDAKKERELLLRQQMVNDYEELSIGARIGSENLKKENPEKGAGSNFWHGQSFYRHP